MEGGGRARTARRHVFEPSGREIWTVIGAGTEHWVDPRLRLCSCRGFYFASRSGGAPCSHVGAAGADRALTVEFSDDEYEGFVDALLADVWAESSKK